MSFAFDTLAYVRRLRDAKVPAEQAEAMADALRDTFNTPPGIATKADLEALESRLLLKLGAFMVAIAGLTLAVARMLT